MTDAPFMVTEGIDGAGKTTIVQNLTDVLEEADCNPLDSFEPSDGTVGQELRRRFETGEDTVSLTDFFLFMADRAEHNEQVVEPALEDGRPVILDRYMDSTRAYQPQAMAGDVFRPKTLIEDCHEVFELEPDMTLFLDIDVDTALDRLNDFKGEEARDNYEQADFLDNVRKNYYEALDIAFETSDRRNVAVIDATQEPREVLEDCIDTIDSMFDEDLQGAAESVSMDV